MKTFFIAALPRSGTAWLSALLTTDKTICIHEGVKFGTYPEIFGELQSLGKEWVGDAGGHIQVNYKRILEEYPDAKFVIVSRDPDEVKESASHLGVPPEMVDENLGHLLKMAGDVKFLHIRFDELFTLDAAKVVWNYCVGTEFDTARWEILRRLNIQASISTHEETIQYVKNGGKPVEFFNPQIK